MTRILAVLAMLALSMTAAQAHTHSVAHYRHHYRYTPVMHLDVPVNRGWIDVAAIAPYPYPSQERSQAAVSMPSGHYSEPTRHYYASSGALSAAGGAIRPADCYGIPWCGCFLRHKLGIANTAYNLADTWFGWGHPSGPCVGCVAVSHHHVAIIVGQSQEGWIVEQGNPYRLGPDSLRWAVAYRSP